MMIIAIVIIISILILITYKVLKNDKEISIYLLKSYLIEDKYDRKSTALILAIFFPITLPHYIYIKNKNKSNMWQKYLKIAVFLGLSLLFFSGIFNVVSNTIDFSNIEIGMTTEFNQKKQERIAFYDKMYKQVSQNAEIALRNDSSFAKIVEIVMNGHKDGLSVSWKWIQQIDPSANYEQVSQFYANLISIVNSNREGFLQQEIVLQTINKEHNNLLRKYPGSIYNLALNRKEFDYKPITSLATEEVEKTGRDENYKIFK